MKTCEKSFSASAIMIRGLLLKDLPKYSLEMPPRIHHLHIDKPVRCTFETAYLSIRCDILLYDVNPRLERANLEPKH